MNSKMLKDLENNKNALLYSKITKETQGLEQLVFNRLKYRKKTSREDIIIHMQDILLENVDEKQDIIKNIRKKFLMNRISFIFIVVFIGLIFLEILCNIK